VVNPGRRPDLGWYGRLVRLAVLTGQRRGELVSLQAKWIDADGWCTIPAEHYKSERPHRFYLTPFARQFVGEVPADPPWSRWKAKLDAGARLGRPFTIHDLRRTMASACRRLGVDRDVVELMLGHAVGGLIGGLLALRLRHRAPGSVRDLGSAHSRHSRSRA
jgi:integrase